MNRRYFNITISGSSVFAAFLLSKRKLINLAVCPVHPTLQEMNAVLLFSLTKIHNYLHTLSVTVFITVH